MKTITIYIFLQILFLSSCNFKNALNEQENSQVEPLYKIEFLEQPSDVTSMDTINPSVRVVIQDFEGNRIINQDAIITLTLENNSNGALLGGTTSIKTVAGIANFGNLTIDKAANGYSLKAKTELAKPTISDSFRVSVGEAAKVVFNQEISNVGVSQVLSSELKVEVHDLGGNIVTNQTFQITLDFLNDPTNAAILGGALVKNTVNGVASFDDITINKAGLNFSLQATSDSLDTAESNSFTVMHGQASKLVFISQPTTSISGENLTVFEVNILDANDNICFTNSDSITLSIGTDPSNSIATLNGTKVVNANNGVATFNDINIDKAFDNYALSATAAGLTSANSANFNITPGTASKLGFSVEPTNSVSAANINPSIVVNVLDAHDNVVTSSSDSITLSIGTDPSNSIATLNGTKVVNANNGVATFNDINIDKAFDNYALSATAAGLTSANSANFNITPGIASKLLFEDQPLDSKAHTPMSAIKVQVTDAQDNIVVSSSANITLSLSNDPSSGAVIIEGNLSINATNGVATFNNIIFNKAFNNFEFTATSTGLNNVVSNSFNISEWAIQHGNSSTAGTPFAGQTNLGNDRCQVGTIDSNGYVYCGGSTDNNLISTNAGENDAFVIKYDPITGEELAAFQLGRDAESSPHIISLSGNETLEGIEVDSNGNIYLIGSTTSNLAENLAMYIGSNYDPLNFPTLNRDIYIVKLDSAMSIVWVKHFGATTTFAPNDPNCVCDNSLGEYVYDTTIDSNGNIFVAGSSTSDLYRDNPYSERGEATGSPQPFADMFVFKIAPDGSVAWIYHNGESSPKSNESIRGIAFHNGELYFTGNTTGNWVEGGGEQLGFNTYDILLGRLDANDGSELMLNQIGATEVTNHSFIVDTQYAEFPVGKPAIDSSGNFYVAGVARGPFAQADANSDTDYDPFILKANSNGVPLAAIQYGGSNVPEPADSAATGILVRGIVLDSNNISYTLFTTKSYQFGENPGSYYDSFVIKLDEQLDPVGQNLGVIQFAGDKLLAGANKYYDESFLDILIDSNEKFYILGTTNSSYAETRSGSNDSIIFKTDL